MWNSVINLNTTTISLYCDDTRWLWFHFCSVCKGLKWLWPLTLSDPPGTAEKSVLSCFSVCGFRSRGLKATRHRLPRPEPPAVQQPCKCFGSAPSSSTASSFWLGAPLTWIQLHPFSSAAGFCLASAKYGQRAFVALRTCSHSYIS